MADNVNNIIYKVHVDTKTGKVNIDGVTKSFEKADQAFLKLQKDVAKGIPNATKSLKGLGDASGSATSATMELSRVISDAPYGIYIISHYFNSFLRLLLIFNSLNVVGNSYNPLAI